MMRACVKVFNDAIGQIVRNLNVYIRMHVREGANTSYAFTIYYFNYSPVASFAARYLYTKTCA
jgi:hypothetical protein